MGAPWILSRHYAIRKTAIRDLELKFPKYAKAGFRAVFNRAKVRPFPDPSRKILNYFYF